MGDALRDAIRKLDAAPLVRFSDLKCGGKHFTQAQALKPGAIETAIASGPDGRVKLDAIAWDAASARFVEITCLIVRLDAHGRVVGEEPPQGRDLVTSLRHDVREYAEDDQHFKALKRLAAMRRAQGSSAAARVDAVLDGPIGALGQLVHDLNVVVLLCDLKPPLARLALELDGAAHRIERISLPQLSLNEGDALGHALLEVQGMVLNGVGLDKVARKVEPLAARMAKVLEAAAHQIFKKV